MDIILHKLDKIIELLKDIKDIQPRIGVSGYWWYDVNNKIWVYTYPQPDSSPYQPYIPYTYAPNPDQWAYTDSPDSTTNTDAKCNCDQRSGESTNGWWCPVHGHLY